jgi:hypothetical protein
MYRTGDLEIVFTGKRDWEDEPVTRLSDSREDSDVPLPAVRLPHSCGAWVIGGVTEVKALIADLEKTLAFIADVEAGRVPKPDLPDDA